MAPLLLIDEPAPHVRRLALNRPEGDVAGLTTMLASRAGVYMTGTVIPLDGAITGCN